MEANAERLKEEIRHLSEQRNALKRGNLELYLKLTQPDFLRIENNYMHAASFPIRQKSLSQNNFTYHDTLCHTSYCMIMSVREGVHANEIDGNSER